MQHSMAHVLLQVHEAINAFGHWCIGLIDLQVERVSDVNEMQSRCDAPGPCNIHVYPRPSSMQAPPCTCAGWTGAGTRASTQTRCAWAACTWRLPCCQLRYGPPPSPRAGAPARTQAPAVPSSPAGLPGLLVCLHRHVGTGRTCEECFWDTALPACFCARCTEMLLTAKPGAG